MELSLLLIEIVEDYGGYVTPHVVVLAPTLREMWVSRVLYGLVRTLKIFVKLRKESTIFDGCCHAEVLLTKQMWFLFEVEETLEVDIEKILTESCSLLHPTILIYCLGWN